MVRAVLARSERSSLVSHSRSERSECSSSGTGLVMTGSERSAAGDEALGLLEEEEPSAYLERKDAPQSVPHLTEADGGSVAMLEES